jgi:hypothetical protein
MGLFSRRPTAEQVCARQDEGIAAFWEWWSAEGKPAATTVFDTGGDHLNLAEAIARRVKAIDPGLAFETGAGRSARHLLVVSPGGDPGLRDVAGRWLAGAPAADDAFQYASSRQPVRDPAALSIQMGPAQVDLASASMVAEAAGGKVHVAVWHPRFPDIPDGVRGQITFLFLDALLGEEAVESYLGEIRWAPLDDGSAVPLTELPARVDALRPDFGADRVADGNPA